MSNHLNTVRLTILTTAFPRFVGDVGGLFISSLTEKLNGRGFHVDVIMPFEAGRLREEELFGAHVHRFQYWFPAAGQRLATDTGMVSDLRSLIGKLQLPFFLISYFLKSLPSSARGRLIHANWIFSGLIAVILGSLYGKPVVLTVHGSDARFAKKSIFLQAVARWILKRVKTVIAVSRSLATDLVEIGVERRRIVVIPNGFDSERFFPVGEGSSTRSDWAKFLWVGRMSPEKNVPTLVSAFNVVAERYPKSKLTLVGNGIVRAEIEALIERYGLTSSVELLGNVPSEHIPEIMREHDVFVLPSLSEGLSVSVLEAMASGLPVIVAAVGGLPEIIKNSQNGYLIDPRDILGLSEVMMQLLRDPALRQRLAEQALMDVQDYSLERNTERHVSVYLDAIS